MQRPIEKFGWEYIGEEDGKWIFIRKDSVFDELAFDFQGNIFIVLYKHNIIFEELQAIYETAKQIMEEK